MKKLFAKLINLGRSEWSKAVDLTPGQRFEITNNALEKAKKEGDHRKKEEQEEIDRNRAQENNKIQDENKAA